MMCELHTSSFVFSGLCVNYSRVIDYDTVINLQSDTELEENSTDSYISIGYSFDYDLFDESDHP